MSEQGNPETTQEPGRGASSDAGGDELDLQATIGVLERRLREAYARCDGVDKLAERIRELEAFQRQTEQQLQERYRELAVLAALLVQAEADAELRETNVVPRVISSSRVGRLVAGVRSKFTTRRVRRRIIASGLFDPAWYIVRYPDVAASGIDPLDHYLYFGAKEGRGVGPSFDMESYLAKNPLALEGNPLLHYLDKVAVDRAGGRK